MIMLSSGMKSSIIINIFIQSPIDNHKFNYQRSIIISSVIKCHQQSFNKMFQTANQLYHIPDAPCMECVLTYLPQQLPSSVGKYSSTMEHLAMAISQLG